ncbi:MAG: ABC transporter substrate-binding protein [Pyrinomonadaceae bacterium]
MERRTKPARAILASLCALIVFCAACARQQPPDDNAQTRADGAKPSVLRIVTSRKIESLDPVKPGHWFITEFGAAELPLILDDDYNLKPWMLESFAQADELNWRLTLRPNVTFQNGKPLTAAALAACMNRQLTRSPSTKSVLPDATVAVTGEREVTLTTLKPDPNVPSALADEVAFPIYDVETVEAAGGDARKLVGSNCYTGAYRIVSLDDREMRLERFANYWQGTPPLEAVSVRTVSDAQARILAVQSDEADIALYPPTEAKRMLANRQDAFFVTSENSGGGPRIFFNVRLAPFDETLVRRAFSLGINYEALAKQVMDGVFDTATGFYPPSFSWAVQNQRTDLEEARRLLDEAGWRAGADGGVRAKNNAPLEATFLVYPQQPDWTTLVTAIQAQLSELGFRIQIRQVDDINAAMKNSTDWNVALNSPGIITTGGAPDSSLREHLTTDAEANYGAVKDQELDNLIDELSHTFDRVRRANLLARIQGIVIAEKAYEVRPVFTRSRCIVGRRYRNYRPSPQLHHVTYATRPAD